MTQCDDRRPSFALGLAGALAQLPPTPRFAEVFSGSAGLNVELYAPIDRDAQEPHDRDELYIIASGIGSLRCADAVHRFGPGDLLFVPAYAVHRFEGFSADFATWVIFFGPVVAPARPLPPPDAGHG